MNCLWWHSWTKWKTTREFNETLTDCGKIVARYPAVKQTRECNDCGILESRTVDV